ncbi:HlyD family type I secretion periplasmic adaptor subunit [Labrys sp. 22185]|uniref:HlyD family type I secretion periplasmic adaptor subunit n=1 Tax=Labrys sp. 22185 TaxID=3453888 RepID=UPI003F837574
MPDSRSNALAVNFAGPSPTLRWSGLILCGLVVAAITGAALAKTEIVASGQGRVVPIGAIRLIQSQIDGRVDDILVREGESVSQGQTLLVLNQANQHAEAERLNQLIARNEGTFAKLTAALEALSRTDPAQDGFLLDALSVLSQASLRADIMKTNQALLTTELQSLSAIIHEIDANLGIACESQKSTQALLEKTEALLQLQQTIFEGATTLQRKGTLSQIEYTRQAQAYTQLQHDKAIQQQDLAIKATQIKALAATRVAKLASTREQWQASRNAVAHDLDDLRTNLTVATRDLAYATVTAPIAGWIEDLKIKTLGAHLAAGEVIANLVPSGEAVEIEAMVPTRETAFLEMGQPVYVKFDAYPAERYAMGHGTIRKISADTRHEGGQWVYTVRVALASPDLALPAGPIPITPGMTATIDIVTGERRLISYLFEPVVRSLMDGAHER